MAPACNQVWTCLDMLQDLLFFHIALFQMKPAKYIGRFSLFSPESVNKFFFLVQKCCLLNRKLKFANICLNGSNFDRYHFAGNCREAGCDRKKLFLSHSVTFNVSIKRRIRSVCLGSCRVVSPEIFITLRRVSVQIEPRGCRGSVLVIVIMLQRVSVHIYTHHIHGYPWIFWNNHTLLIFLLNLLHPTDIVMQVVSKRVSGFHCLVLSEKVLIINPKITISPLPGECCIAFRPTAPATYCY